MTHLPSGLLPQRKPRPVTVERIEAGLDRLAEYMVLKGIEGEKYLPLYERLESDLANLRAAQTRMAAVHERLRRSKDRTAARSAQAN